MAEPIPFQQVLDDAIKGLPAGAVKYDLGCGPTPWEGFTGIDLYAKGESIQNIDLYTFPWPIADGSVDYFRASHFLEHVPDWNGHFEEIYRCLKVGGFYEIISPYYANRRFFQDPDHKQAILQERFAYLDQTWLRKNNLTHSNPKVNFIPLGWGERLHDYFQNAGLSDDALEWHRMFAWNVIEDIAVILRKEPMPE